MNMLKLTKEDLIRLQEMLERQIKLCDIVAAQNDEDGVIDINLVRYSKWSHSFLMRVDNLILNNMSEFEYEL